MRRSEDAMERGEGEGGEGEDSNERLFVYLVIL